MIKAFVRNQCLAVVAVILFSLCGCQENPSGNVVISKNDGSFDAGKILSAGESHAPDATQEAKYDAEFYSTDRSVAFRMNIDETVTNANMPVIEVAPYYLTEEDAQRVATVLLGDGNYYEKDPMLAPIYSKSEIQECIALWSQYINEDAFVELYGEKDADAVRAIQAFLDRYNAMLETASEQNPHPLCDWTFKPASYYISAPDDITQEDIASDNDEISATIKLDGIPYVLSVAKRDRSDFKLSWISASINTGISPKMINSAIYNAKLLRTAEPTEEQITKIRAKADTMLRQMKLGDWLVDQCLTTVEYVGDTPEYTICVTAVPVFGGVAAIRQPQLTNLKSEDAYASNLYLTDAEFKFNAYGDLVSFNMRSPLTVKDVLNENVAVMHLDDLMEKAKNHLQLSDIYAYGIDTELKKASDKLACTVTVTDLEYNLTRVKVPNTDASYYYVPGIVLKGNVEYIEKETAEVFMENEGVTLVALNGVDGSVIKTNSN